MPITVVKVTDYSTMMRDLRIHFKRAGIPEYSYKEHRAGFEVWPTRHNEGEDTVIWHTFDPADDCEAQVDGLRTCAAALMVDKFWVRIDTPSMYTRVNRPTLRVIHQMDWLK